MQYLIRMVRGRKPLVCPMRERQLQGSWHFKDGVTVINDSRSDGLRKAQELFDRRRADESQAL